MAPVAKRLAAFGLLVVLLSTPAILGAEEQVDYLTQIKPVLQQRCYACHGALKQENGLRLDTVASMTKGGDSGAALVAGKSKDSLLVAAVTGAAGFRMPPQDEFEPLEQGQIELLARWIDQGASGPADEPPQPSPLAHWAFRRPVRPAIPAAPGADTTDNAIDALLAAKRRELGLTPNRPADKPVLLRRMYLDLVGLPPTRAELHAFQSDPAPDAYERVVDRLLASPRYGERWGRHWMDVWRYSDWYGSEGADRITNSQRHIWRWRDWIVESLNDDKGYDRMLVEMLAGDELAPSDPEVVRATGYLARNQFRLDSNVPLTMSVEHTSRAFLGLTLECCRCHDHKYDPLSQRDYYRFRAFFEPLGIRIDRVPGQADVYADGLARVYDAQPDAPTYLYVKGDERRPDKDRPLSAGIPAFFETALLDGRPLAFDEVALEPEEFYPALRPHFVRDERANLQREIDRLTEARARLSGNGEQDAAKLLVAEKELAAVQAKFAATNAVIVADRLKIGGAPQDQFEALALAASETQRFASICQAELNITKAQQQVADLQEKAKTDKSQAARLTRAQQDLKKYEKELAAAEQARPSPNYAPLGDVYPKTSTGRRTALARWLADDGNPLTARVAVNHIWMRHFGEPLVQSVFDFGLAGQPPTHPELLDWLAVEFVESGWSMKHLHRLIVTSHAYRMSSSNAGHGANRAIDADNQWLWRMNPRRMEAEVVRDSLLYVSGQLDDTLGGADIPADQAERVLRRSLYFKHSGVDQVKLLQLFDGASVIECYRRRESVIPQQALAMSNSRESLNASRLIAHRLSAECEAGGDFVLAAFEVVLGRRPSDIELEECLAFLERQTAFLTENGNRPQTGVGQPTAAPPSTELRLRAQESLVHVLLNHNDFVTIR